VSSANFHETYRERGKVKTGSNRSFGFTVGGILLAIALVRWVFGEAGLSWLTLAFGTAGILLVVLGLVSPSLLAPLNRVLTKLGFLLSKVMNPVILFLIFVVAFVPVGWLMRVLGNDPMRMKRDSTATTYWIDRVPPGPAPDTMINQF
jgi:hypothetical protein